MAVATFAGGCFWCLDAVFSQLAGVYRVTSGYCGGYNANPTYEEVCSGATGHAEAVRIDFNSELISYRQLLEVFFAIHIYLLARAWWARRRLPGSLRSP